MILAGSLIITIFVAIEFERLAELITYLNKSHSTLIMSVLVLLIIPMAFFLGVIIESITDFIRYYFEMIIGDEGRDNLHRLICGKTYKNYSVLQAYSIKGLENVYYDKDDLKDVRKGSLLVGFFFNTANSETIDWVVQHYATYRLSLNYIVLLPFICYTLFELKIIFFSNPYIVLTVWSLSTLLLYRFAIERKLYAYEVLYRHIVTVLCYEQKNE